MSLTTSTNDDGAPNILPLNCFLCKVLRIIKTMLTDPCLCLRLKSASIIWVHHDSSICHRSHCFNQRCSEMGWSTVHSNSLNLACYVVLFDHDDKVFEAFSTAQAFIIPAAHGDPCFGVWSCFKQVENGLNLFQTWNGLKSNDVRFSLVG